LKPKYALYEIERRWLVPADAARGRLTAQPVCLTDTYVTGTRLRLRRLVTPAGDELFKLCKKYGDRDGAMEAITNLYLSEQEYHRLGVLPGLVVAKERHHLGRGSLGVYRLPDEDLYVFEIEFDSPADAVGYVPPIFVGREITGDADYTGLALARRANPEAP